ncbi:hypothetical protein [Nocardiopsis salina]|uniref:hypothetical protein n=1 Tax=Nocardiopsis salina TaxID=245836 RepID=UPI00034742F4|nr:hypothetical protein [Nocardiopsis salina]
MTEPDLPVCFSCQERQTRPDARFCRACGTPLAAEPPPAADHEPGPPRQEPRGRPRWRRRLLVAGAVLAVLALTAAGLRAFQAATTDPTDPVEELLDDLADGHVEAVLEHADIDSPLVLDRVLVEGYTPPHDLRTTKVTYGHADADTQRPNRGTASVDVEYELDGATHTAYVQVARQDTGWVRDWEVTDLDTLIGELVVTSDHLDEVRVASAEIDTALPPSQSRTNPAVPALPGTYTLATTDDEELFADEVLDEVAVFGPRASPVTIVQLSAADLTVREGLVDEVAEQVEDHLDECARAETLAPPGCPLGLESTPTRSTGDVSWELLGMPEIDLVASDQPTLNGAPLEVVTTAAGSAEVEWTYAHTDDEDPDTETVEVTVGGTVTVDDDGEPAWTP